MKNNSSRSRHGINILAVVLLSMISSAQAELLTLNPDILPSRQGWTYIGSPQMEAAAFTIHAHGGLMQSTIGSGSNSFARYQVNDVVDTSKAMRLSFTARISGYEKFGEGSVGLGFNFLIRDGKNSYRLSMTDSLVYVNSGRAVSLDTTVFHDYILNIDPDGGYELLIDGHKHVVCSQSCAAPGVVGQNVFFFGDSTAHENTDAEIGALSFSVLPDAEPRVVVPEHYLALRPNQTYEAEFAASGVGYSGGGDVLPDGSYLSYIDFYGEGFVEWTVYVPRSSTYNLVFRYALGRGDRALAISVDGQVINPALMFTRVGEWKDWSVWDDLTIATQLSAGRHTIRATTTGRNGPDLDFLRLDDIGLPSVPDNVPDDSHQFGKAFSAVGDVDGDGFRDIGAFTSILSTSSTSDRCRVTLHSGMDGSLIDSVFPGAEDDCGSGFTILDLGDVNSDGVDDFGATTTGQLSIYSGKDRALLARISGASGMGGVVIGDINGDSVSDLAIGSLSAEGSQSEEGRVFLVSGVTAEVVRILDNPYPNVGETNQEFGGDVTDLGDVDGDGVSDIAVGARHQLVEGLPRGAIFVFSGATGELIYDVKSPDMSISGFFPIAGHGEVGRGLQRLKDITGDSIDDFIVGDSGNTASGPDTWRIGRAFIFSGADGTLFRTIDPPAPIRFGRFGETIAALPDLNGDGISEYAIRQTNAYPQERGAAWYLFSGLDGSLLLILGSDSRSKILDLGDLDGDGSPELAIGQEELEIGLLQVFSLRAYPSPPVPETRSVIVRSKPYWLVRNTIDLASTNGLWVAIMSREGFDPLTVSVGSVVFGNTAAAPRGVESADRNKDNVPDLILRYKLKDLSLACGEQDVTVSGMTDGGTEFDGILRLNIIGCGL